MQITIYSGIGYQDVKNMTNSEREILVEAIKEKRDAETPGKSTQYL